MDVNERKNETDREGRNEFSRSGYVKKYTNEAIREMLRYDFSNKKYKWWNHLE